MYPKAPEIFLLPLEFKCFQKERIFRPLNQSSLNRVPALLDEGSRGLDVDSANGALFRLVQPLVDADLVELVETWQATHLFLLFVIRETNCASF